MTEKQMYEASYARPSNYFKLGAEQQWSIDKTLGILDWEGRKLTTEEQARWDAHYKDD